MSMGTDQPFVISFNSMTLIMIVGCASYACYSGFYPSRLTKDVFRARCQHYTEWGDDYLTYIALGL